MAVTSRRSIHEHLVLFNSNNSVISKYHSGLLNLHSTKYALTNFHNVPLDGLFNRCARPDFRKAFDTVDHQILFNKIKCFDISGIYYGT